ncbi:MAG: phospho-N-acetylmuramoyl-pentapeptide-transferase [Lachnospiraceae bacterium]|nr:phospho-N-acetylmuramoyl-pentapeptide-transferase [Lachnospiraceae bacterium]
MDPLLFLPVLIAFVLSAVLCPVLIPVLRKLKFGQQVRAEGNPEHLKKQGTPTMGGIAFLAAVLVTCLAFVFIYPRLLPVLLLTLGFGAIGFADDFLKVVKKQSEGFKPLQKLVCQFVITGLFAWYCAADPEIGTGVIIPFTGGQEWDMGWLYIPFVFFVVLGTDNGVNFTDGLDGLCGSVTAVVALFFFLVAGVSGNPGVSVVSGAVAGALMGFLISNAFPAKVFMGDTGALALGGFVASAALVLKMGWFVLIIGLVYAVEVLSVILQVSYFKLTHGKRLFRMAPIHHHFELCGYSETRIVTLFTAVTVLLCMLGYIAL